MIEPPCNQLLQASERAGVRNTATRSTGRHAATIAARANCGVTGRARPFRRAAESSLLTPTTSAPPSAAVASAVYAVAKARIPVHVIGLIPATDNRPGPEAIVPGDIITMHNGMTVEVLNTDAEGRMILCDGLAYAVKQKCDVIIDIATLTGACMVALGRYKAGLMGNDDKLIKQLQQAAEDSGEKVWPMPSGDEYAQEMKSKIADLKNTGSKFGGACTAAAFLRQFVGSAKWAHLDIAGVDMIDKATAFATEGASGFGVRLLTTYLMNLVQQKH